MTTVIEALAAATVVALIAVLTGTTTVLAIPVLGALLAHLPGAADHQMSYLLGLIGVLFGFKTALAFAVTAVNNRLVARVKADLSARLFEGYLAFPFELQTTQHSGESQHRIDEGAQVVFGVVLWCVASISTHATAAAGVLVVLLVAQPVMTLVLAAVSAAWVVFQGRWLRARLRGLGTERDEVGSNRQRVMHEALSAGPTLGIGAKHQFVRRFRSLADQLVRLEYNRVTWMMLPRIASEGVFIIVVLAVIGLRGDTTHGGLVTAQLGLLAYAGLRLMPAANSVADSLNKIVNASPILERTRDELARMERLASQVAAVDLPELQSLDIEAASFAYPDSAAPILSDVSVRVRRGERLAIVGASGTGKSTLARLMCGLLVPEPGAVVLNETPLDDVMRAAWRSAVAYVPQDEYIQDATVAENVALGDENLDRDRVLRALKTARLSEYVRGLAAGIDTQVGQRGARMSGGQRQRLAIARALYAQPKLLVLDESTSGLDHETESALLDGLGGTVVICSHRASVARACDRVIVLEAGRVVADGTFEQLDGQCKALDVVFERLDDGTSPQNQPTD